MRNQIVINKEFYILSRSIDNASKCKIVDVCDDCFKVSSPKSKKFENDESVELFTMTDKGQLYFESIVKEIKNDIISIWFPITYKYLQRREFSRIALDKEIVLKSGKKLINARLVDISAGGLKVKTQEQLLLQKEYHTEVEIDNKTIKCVFEPIRLEFQQNDFIASGRFKEISNYDRIELVQYCFMKQIENSNK